MEIHALEPLNMTTKCSEVVPKGLAGRACSALSRGMGFLCRASAKMPPLAKWQFFSRACALWACRS